MRAQRIAVWTAGALACCALGACGGGADLGAYPLYRNLASTRRVQVLVPAGVDLAPLTALARELERRGDWRVEFERGRELDDGAARICIADHTSGEIGALAQLHGILFEPDTGAVWFDGRRYLGAREALQVTLEDPRRPGWPVSVYLASSAATAASFVTDLAPTWKPGFRCWRDGIIEREGTWTDYGALAPGAACGRLARLAELPVETRVFDGGSLLIHGAVDAAALDRYRARLESVHARVATLLGARAAPEAALRVHAWPDLERLALATGTWALATRGPAGEVHAVVAPGLADDGGAEFARSLALALAGPPADGWLLDALGVWAAQSWFGVALDDWTDFLFAAHLEPSVAALVEPAPRASPHLIAPLRAVLLDEALARAGAETVQRAWREGGLAMWVPGGQFAARAEGDRREASDRQRGLRTSRLRAATGAAFLAGVHLVPGADGDGRGLYSLGTRDAAQSTRDVRALGANALALAPSAALDQEFATWPGARRSEPFETATPDAGLFAAAAAARNEGLAVLIAPQLLDSRSSTWTGAIMTSTRTRWEAFFVDLEACLLHYALLAELCDARILCLGSELASTTKSVYAQANRSRTPAYLYENGLRWNALIASVRRAFRGGLTYAADYVDEARSLEFWGELDFVGMDLFRPLAPHGVAGIVPDDDAATLQLAGQLRQLVAVAQLQGKPALVVEIGFAATDQAALDPERATGRYDVYEQERLVRCLSEALRRVRAQKLPLAGAFLYSWGVDPEHGNGVDRSFTLRNRPAADVLPKLFAGQ